MAWYFISLNLLFVAIVVGGIVGPHLWAIATQHRDWPKSERKTAADATGAPRLTAGLIPRPAV
jgi:quinol-cytochrome oxidoreductase complex cytochrome b subunit